MRKQIMIPFFSKYSICGLLAVMPILLGLVVLSTLSLLSAAETNSFRELFSIKEFVDLIKGTFFTYIIFGIVLLPFYVMCLSIRFGYSRIPMINLYQNLRLFVPVFFLWVFIWFSFYSVLSRRKETLLHALLSLMHTTNILYMSILLIGSLLIILLLLETHLAILVHGASYESMLSSRKHCREISAYVATVIMALICLGFVRRC